MSTNVMATAWMVIWFVIAIALVTHFGLNAYRESKRKRIKAEKKLEEQQKEFEKEFNKFTQQRKEIYERLEEEDLELLDLLEGYRSNNIVFNLNSFKALLKEYSYEYTALPGAGHHFGLRIKLNHRTCTLSLIKLDKGVNALIYCIDIIAKG